LSREKESRAQSAGRGGIAVLGAKVFFIFTGLAQQTLLPRAIGLAGYGALARVLALSNILNNVVVASSTQGVSRAVARSIGAESRAFRSTLRVHVPVAIALAAGFALAAPALASFEGAPYIMRPLLCMALVALFYGLYAPIIGLLNGRGRFTRQAALDVTFAVLRTAGLLVVGWLVARSGGSGVFGSALGFALAAGAIVPLAALFARGSSPRASTASTPPLSIPSTSADVRPLGYLGELLPLAAAQFFTNAVMQVDITLLGHFLSQGGDPKIADEWVAVYRACQLFAFLPYQLLLSVTLVLFPLLARAKAEGDHEGVKRYVERGARLALVACAMMVGVIVALPRQLLAFAYTGDVADRGAETLRVLALGQSTYAMMAIATTVLASLGYELLSALITLVALGMVLGGCALLAPRASFGGPQLLATATGTSVALLCALIAAAVAVTRIAGGFVRASSVARVVLALVAVASLGRMLPTHSGRLLTPVLAIGIVLAYLAVLVVTRELTGEDAAVLRSLRGRPRAA
jgi:stage V sporulation protein B